MLPGSIRHIQDLKVGTVSYTFNYISASLHNQAANLGKDKSIMKSCLGILVTFAFLTLGTSQLSAQWVQTNGPSGGHVYCLAISGTNLFAGTPFGVFRQIEVQPGVLLVQV